MTDQSVTAYNSGAGVPFKVVNITETTGQDGTGRFVAGKQVTYQLKTGLSGSIFVPDATFTEDAVRALLTAAAANLYSVSMIQQGMT